MFPAILAGNIKTILITFFAQSPVNNRRHQHIESSNLNYIGQEWHKKRFEITLFQIEILELTGNYLLHGEGGHQGVVTLVSNFDEVLSRICLLFVVFMFKYVNEHVHTLKVA